MPVSIIDPSGSALDGVLIGDLGLTKRALSFSKNTGRWVYCNHPEHLSSDFYGDYNLGNHFLNQVTAPAGESQVFASYINESGNSFTFGIQMYNPGTSSITVTKRNNGFVSGSGASGWQTVPGQVWSNFFQNTGGQTYTLNSGGSAWVLEGSVAAGDLFNSSLRFESTGSVVVTVYAYRVKSNVNGTATCIPYESEAVYSGWGSGWFLSTSLTLTASDILSQSQQSIYHSLSNCSSGNSGEMISINLVQGGTASCSQSYPLNNLGNWGAQYYFSVTLRNDTSSSREFIGYVGANSSGAFIALQSGSVVKYKLLETSTERRWKWMSQTVPANSSTTIDFQYITCANTYTPAFMQWKVV